MANGKLLRQLVKAGVDGDTDAFRKASEAVISEERGKQHHLLANDLEKVLHGPASSANKSAFLRFGNSVPVDKERGLDLIELRQPIREMNDLVVSDDIRSAIDEFLLEHFRSDILQSNGLQPTRKLIFFGPPGCGKSLTAEVLATELSLPLATIRIDSVVSSYLGETAANLRKVFDFIERRPVVALFDEFDALAKDRNDGGDHGELKRVVNAVLQMIDAYRGQSIIIAATNHESLLDSAIWRRFDEAIKFEKPNVQQIKSLLTVRLCSTRRNFEIDDTKVASLFKGLAHADIERVINRAKKEMILQGREFLEAEHLDSSLRREVSRAKLDTKN
jgi:AAA+ superfamily predicted ATPase